MIGNYKFEEDVTALLFEELKRNGITVEQTGDGYTFSRAKGSVTFGEKENTESGVVYTTFATYPIPFSASMSLLKEVDKIMKRIGGTSSDILEGVIPPRKRKIIRALYGLHIFCMLGGMTLGAISYFQFGEAEYIFKSKPYGPIIGLFLGLGALIGIFGAHGIFLSHKNKTSEPGGAGRLCCIIDHSS